MSASPAEAPPAPAPSPRRPAGPMTFRAVPGTIDDLTEQAQQAWQATGEGTSPLDDQLAGSPSVSAPSSDASDEDASSGPHSSPESSTDPRSRKPLSTKAQQLAARQAVKIAGSMAHQYLARDEAAQVVGLYLVDDESAEQIGDPLARLAARHAPIGGGEMNEDVADGIAAMLGVANFVTKQIHKGHEAAAWRAQYAGRAPQLDDDQQPAGF